MIQMRDAINNQHLTQLGEENALEVNCVTCHHGQEEPKTIEYVMNEAIEKAVLDLIDLVDKSIDYAPQNYHDIDGEIVVGVVIDIDEKKEIGGALTYIDLGNARTNKATSGGQFSGDYSTNEIFILGINFGWR